MPDDVACAWIEPNRVSLASEGRKGIDRHLWRINGRPPRTPGQTDDQALGIMCHESVNLLGLRARPRGAGLGPLGRVGYGDEVFPELAPVRHIARGDGHAAAFCRGELDDNMLINPQHGVSGKETDTTRKSARGL